MKFARVEGRFDVENRSKWPFLIVYCLIAILMESLFLIFIKIHLSPTFNLQNYKTFPETSLQQS